MTIALENFKEIIDKPNSESFLLEYFLEIFDRPEKVSFLKEMIFNLAITGKLVKQNLTDEPASLLLEKIKKQREISIKGKKRKEEKFECSKVVSGDLPKGWSKTSLGNLGVIFNGNSINAKTKELVYGKVKNGYEYIGTKDVGFDGFINYDNGIKIPYDESKFKIAHKKSVLICAEGGSAGKKIAITEKDICFGNKLYTIECYQGIESEFIYYVFKSRVFYEKFKSQMTGIIGGISIAKFKALEIDLPPIEEQKRIIDRVNILLKLCEKLECILEKKVKCKKISAKSVFNSVSIASNSEELEKLLKFIIENFKELSLGDDAVKELKNCILQLAVQGKLVKQDLNDEPANILFEKINEERECLIQRKKIKRDKKYPEINDKEYTHVIPESWKFIRLKDLGYNLGQKKPEKQFVYIDVGSVNKEKGLLNDELNVLDAKNAPSRARKIVNKDSLIYSTIRPYLLNTTLLNREFDYEVIASTAFAVINTFEKINSKYLLYYLRSPIFIKYVESQMVGMAYPAINEQKLFMGIIAIPPFKEQERIVRKIENLMALCETLENKISIAKKQNEKLMKAIINDITRE